MTLIKVNKPNRTNGNTSVANFRGNTPSIVDPETGLGSLFDTFTNPFWKRNLLDDFFDENLNLGRGTIGTTIPAVNIEETDNSLVINVAAPGIDKKNFIIQLNDNQLHIGYKKENQSKNDESNHWRKEFNFEYFERNFTLPHIVEGEKISASYTDGILSIIVPKKEEAKRKPTKTVEIK